MKLTFLGTGTSQGVPVIACSCKVCTSDDDRDKRLRVSVLIEHEGVNVVVDSGPDFRYQMLKFGVKSLNAILFTHEHKDHIAGLDDVRAFNFFQKSAMDIYADKRVHEALKREFAYVFAEFKYPGIPLLNLHEISSKPFTAAGIEFVPIEVMHYMLPVIGFRVKDLVYITDAKTVSNKEREKIKGCKVLIINALQKEKHISHFTFEEAIGFAKEIGAQKTFFTHISHRLGQHAEVSHELPAGIELAYDGLQIEF